MPASNSTPASPSKTLRQLREISRNLWWSWNPEAHELFRDLNPEAFAGSLNNPVVALNEADPDVLESADYAARVQSVWRKFADYMALPKADDLPSVGYLCMEFGLHESLRLYSGGLGILAGDHVKAASDVNLPFTAVGLFLREGYFQQSFTPDGWQTEYYSTGRPKDFPAEVATSDDGTPLIVTVYAGSQAIHMIAWKVQVGHADLYLLDTDIGANLPEFRGLTSRLYSGDKRTRILQELVLGLGGIRLMRALGIQPDVFHMNEGHCSFATLELLHEALNEGFPMHEAMERVREMTVFTTHTPVEAGHDRFPPDLVLDTLRSIREKLGLSEYDLLSFGRVDANDASGLFNMTLLGFKLSRKQNGVSRLNGILSRRMWKNMWGMEDESAVPITHVTNGIHLGTWAAQPAQIFLDTYFPGWRSEARTEGFWNAISDVSDDVFWSYRNALRERLIAYVKHRLSIQTLPQQESFDTNALTIGFARRFATYKRAALLFSDPARLAALVNNPDRPVQFIFAGKAHPHDEGGKKIIQHIFQMTQRPEFLGKVVLLENYNMETGRHMVSGSDVWLNNPRRPMEASGTSGQKVAIHGGLNLSILDGWWPEGHAGNNGWSIGSDASADIKDPAIQDPEDAEFLYQALENDVIPMFYDRDVNGLPLEWLKYMRSAFAGLVYEFSAERMVRDYARTIYAAPVAVPSI